jgi:hypothetical protein
MKISAYLWRNRHGTWYFRAVIPQHLRHHFPQRREIRRSLQTDSRAFALRVARAARVEFDNLLDQLESTNDKRKGTSRTDYIGINGLKFGNLKIDKLEINHEDPAVEQALLDKVIGAFPTHTTITTSVLAMVLIPRPLSAVDRL